MFNKLAVVSVAALAAVAVASPADISARTDTGDCNTGPVQCCQSTQEPTSHAISGLLGLLGIDISSLTGLVGLTCNPITVIGAGGSGCTASPVCCSNNTFGGLISLGCIPINIDL
jgi:hypothetical protein